MRKYFTLSSFLFMACVIFLCLGSLSARFVGLPEMRTALQAGEKYKVTSKSGARTFQGEKLERLTARVTVFTNVFLVLIPLLILCAAAALKWEFHAALVGGAFVLVAHLLGLLQVGWGEYTAMSARSGAVSMAFSLSVLGILPAIYVLYMRHNRLKFHPDVPEY